nr:hypothetical protein OG409_35750 [Streptomyces sp. NBC_00974]
MPGLATVLLTAAVALVLAVLVAAGAGKLARLAAVRRSTARAATA